MLTTKTVRITLDEHTVTFTPVYLPHPSELDIAALTGDSLLLCENLPASLADALHRSKLSYLTRRGDVHLRAPGFLVAYKKNRKLPKALRAAPQKSANLFATKRAQIIGVLLAYPELMNRSIRDIATATGTSTGYVHGTFTHLEHLGFVQHWDGGAQFVEKKQLINAWALSYPTGLGVDNVLLRGYCNGKDFRIPHGLEALISGEKAVPDKLIPDDTLAFYVDNEAFASIQKANRFVKNPTSHFRTAIELRRKYWQVEAQPFQGGSRRMRRNSLSLPI